MVISCIAFSVCPTWLHPGTLIGGTAGPAVQGPGPISSRGVHGQQQESDHGQERVTGALGGLQEPIACMAFSAAVGCRLHLLPLPPALSSSSGGVGVGGDYRDMPPPHRSSLL